MNYIKRILAAILVACIALSLVGCGDTSWVCEVDGQSVASGLYIYYQTEGYGNALFELYQQNSDYLMAYIYYYNYGYVEPTLFDVEMSDGATVRDHINKYAIDMCKQVVVVDKLFDELGLEIPAEEQALLDNQIRSAWSNSKNDWEAIGVSEASFKAAVMSNYKEDAVFDAYYEIGGLNGTTEQEIEAYFADNYARIKYMTFTFAESMDDAVDSARKDEQLRIANDYLDLAQSGSDFDELIEQYNKYLKIISEENSEEVESDEEDVDLEADEAEPDEYANEVILTKEGTYPTEKFVNYVFTTCPVGEFSIIQDDTCFYLVQRLDILERDGLYSNYRDSILFELFDSDYTGLINQRLAGYTVNINDSAVKRYKAEKAFPDAFEN